MTRPRRTSTSDAGGENPVLLAPREEVEQELNDRIRLGHELAAANISDRAELEARRSDYYTWDDFNRELLKRRFSTSSVADEYSHIGPFIGGGYDYTLDERIADFRKDVGDKVRRLTSILERLPLIEESVDVQRQAASPEEVRAVKQGVPESIFIVHGHDDAAKLAVHGFLREVTSLEVVILHDEPSMGRTVIEKVEQVGARNGFAVAILTADDEGRARGTTELNPRGRQNVVFEFGFFVGLLGRSHTVVLYEEGVERPSDLEGLVYIPYDSGGAWKIQLARELKAAGVNVDLNKAV